MLDPNSQTVALHIIYSQNFVDSVCVVCYIYIKFRLYHIDNQVWCVSFRYQMLAPRQVLTRALLLRHFRHSSTAAAQDFDEVPLTYLEGFPKPDPKYAETITALPRALSGKNISAKERKAGRVPSIVFEQEDGQHGGNKRLISVQNNQIKKLVNHLGRTYFLSRLFDLEVRPDFESEDIIEKVRVLPRVVCNL